MAVPFSKRCLYTVLSLIGLLFSSAALAQNPQQQTQVATLFNQPITLADIAPDNAAKQEAKQLSAVQYRAVIENMRKQNLASKIIDGVMQDFQQRKAITVDETLVEKFRATFKDHFDEQNFDEQKRQQIARKQVLQWQTDKALYEEFGGTVVFQQTNPQFPIEGYLTLFKYYADQGAFTFSNKDDEAAFWQPFQPPFELAIASEDINFSAPWWLP